MFRCTRLHNKPLAADRAQARVLTLPYDERVKSRLAGMTADGTAVAVLLPRGTVLRDGAVLVADSGEYVVVRAAAQPLTRVTAESPLHLLRVVYHLANRHVHAQLAVDHVLIERDPVLEKMLGALGARIEHVELPFDPEAGAYDGHAHAHWETHDDVSASIGEQLSIEAHRKRSP